MLFSLEAQRLFLRLPSRWRNITFHSERAKKMWPRHSIALAEPRSKISWSYLSLFHSALCHCDCDCIKHVFVMIKARALRERRRILLVQFGTTKSTSPMQWKIWQSKKNRMNIKHFVEASIYVPQWLHLVFASVCIMHVQDLAKAKTYLHDYFSVRNLHASKTFNCHSKASGRQRV